MRRRSLIAPSTREEMCRIQVSVIQRYRDLMKFAGIEPE